MSVISAMSRSPKSRSGSAGDRRAGVIRFAGGRGQSGRITVSGVKQPDSISIETSASVSGKSFNNALTALRSYGVKLLAELLKTGGKVIPDALNLRSKLGHGLRGLLRGCKLCLKDIRLPCPVNGAECPPRQRPGNDSDKPVQAEPRRCVAKEELQHYFAFSIGATVAMVYGCQK